MILKVAERCRKLRIEAEICCWMMLNDIVICPVKLLAGCEFFQSGRTRVKSVVASAGRDEPETNSKSLRGKSGHNNIYWAFVSAQR